MKQPSSVIENPSKVIHNITDKISAGSNDNSENGKLKKENRRD